MTITIDKIKEMNLQRGTPIEVIFPENNSNLEYKQLVYFGELNENEVGTIFEGFPSITLVNDIPIKHEEFNYQKQQLPLSEIKDIKILEYKK